MANKDRPRGAEPMGEIKSVTKYVAGAAIAPGEFVQQSADGKLDPATSVSVCCGVALTRAAADGDDVIVADSPEQKFIVQADGSDIDTQTDIGLLYNILDTADDTTYRIARMQLDSSTGDAGTSANGALRLLAIEDRPDNALGAQVDCVVKINKHQFGDNQDGI